MSIQSSHPERKHAIVIGGSIAGLTTARVLINHFDKVTIIERDHYPQRPDFRPGVPQGRQVHQMLMPGRIALEKLFPGITRKLLDQGAIPYDLFKDIIVYYGEGHSQRFPSRLNLYSCSRILIEWNIHHELLQYQQLAILEGYEVVGLLTDTQNQRVTGVKIRERSHQAPAEQQYQELEANLVVDASGRSSAMPQWLQERGFLPPPETMINSFLGYATRMYELKPDPQRDWTGIAAQASIRQGMRAAALNKIEGNRWLLVLVGVGRDYPPNDDAGYLEFARSLPEPLVYEVMKDAQPLSKIYGYRRTENRWYHYEQLSKLPENLLIIGDALCAFNPIYGQGMTIATLEAQELDTYLRNYEGKDLQGLTAKFQQRLAKMLVVPWQLSTSTDARLPTTEIKGSHANTSNKLLDTYIDRLITMIPHNGYIAQAFFEVAQLSSPPTLLFRPDIILKTLLRISQQRR
jgi:2-polyprenyl-6-methoxyphenol hydroxylase-like FAD-dependent oxidoreductase